MNSRKCTLVMCVTILAASLGAQELGSEERRRDLWADESKRAMRSSHAKAFAEALQDPNIMIGVFQVADLTALESFDGDVLELLRQYETADNRFGLRILKRIKSIKGQFEEPIVFFSPQLPARFWNGGPVIPPFVPLRGSRWILAMERTTREKRIALFGDRIEECSFINDKTFFKVHHFGYGTLCLKRVTGSSPSALEASEDTVADLEAIQGVASLLSGGRLDPNEMTTVQAVGNSLKTDIARSVLETMRRHPTPEHQDPNSASK